MPDNNDKTQDVNVDLSVLKLSTAPAKADIIEETFELIDKNKTSD